MWSSVPVDGSDVSDAGQLNISTSFAEHASASCIIAVININYLGNINIYDDDDDDDDETVAKVSAAIVMLCYFHEI